MEQARRVLYGGSPAAANAGEFLQLGGSDGALVGGARLKAAEFLPIVQSRLGWRALPQPVPNCLSPASPSPGTM